MKKIFLSLFVVLSLIACGSKSTSISTDTLDGISLEKKKETLKIYIESIDIENDIYSKLTGKQTYLVYDIKEDSTNLLKAKARLISEDKYLDYTVKNGDTVLINSDGQIYDQSRSFDKDAYDLISSNPKMARLYTRIYYNTENKITKEIEPSIFDFDYDLNSVTILKSKSYYHDFEYIFTSLSDSNFGFYATNNKINFFRDKKEFLLINPLLNTSSLESNKINENTINKMFLEKITYNEQVYDNDTPIELTFTASLSGNLENYTINYLISDEINLDEYNNIILEKKKDLIYNEIISKNYSVSNIEKKKN